MGVVDGAIRGIGRTVSRAATATTAAAGAVGGAAINGVVGGVKGAAEGIQQGMVVGSKSTPAAALVIGAVGAVGLVEWPILLAVGGGALLLRRLSDGRDQPSPPTRTTLTSVSNGQAPQKAAPQKTAAKKAPAKAAAKKTAGRRAGKPVDLPSTN